jgi:multidrug resistance efflux pump
VTQQKYEQDQFSVAVEQAALDQALADLDVAKLNLERSTVTAPINGIVTNFGLLPGRYVTAGAPILAIIDSDTFRVDGYFEETKLRNVHVGDRASVRLIGDPRVLTGHVESIASGIEDQSRSTSNDLLASVNPTFNWVRLAQRVPVRIKLDELPDDSRSGRTATVFVGDARFMFR